MRSILSVVLISFVFVLSPASAQKRNITEKDLFNFVWVGDPQISPDGARVAFVRVTVNEKKDGYDTSIWTVSTISGETHQLTTGIRDLSPRWSVDCLRKLKRLDARSKADPSGFKSILCVPPDSLES